jgi:hypothetical protein
MRLALGHAEPQLWRVAPRMFVSQAELFGLRLVRIVQRQSEFVEFRLIEIKDVVLLPLVGVAGVLGKVVRISQVMARVVGIHLVRVLDHGFDVGRELKARGARLVITCRILGHPCMVRPAAVAIQGQGSAPSIMCRSKPLCVKRMLAEMLGRAGWALVTAACFWRSVVVGLGSD